MYGVMLTPGVPVTHTFCSQYLHCVYGLWSMSHTPVTPSSHRLQSSGSSSSSTADSVLLEGLKHHFLITGFFTLLGLLWDFEQISFGTSIQVSLAASLGKSFVTNLQDLIGAISHSSTGLSTRMDLGSSLHVTGPWYEGLKQILL